MQVSESHLLLNLWLSDGLHLVHISIVLNFAEPIAIVLETVPQISFVFNEVEGDDFVLECRILQNAVLIWLLSVVVALVAAASHK